MNINKVDILNSKNKFNGIFRGYKASKKEYTSCR